MALPKTKKPINNKCKLELGKPFNDVFREAVRAFGADIEDDNNQYISTFVGANDQFNKIKNHLNKMNNIHPFIQNALNKDLKCSKK